MRPGSTLSEWRSKMSPPDPAIGLHVHGRIISLEHLREEGGKPVVHIELDAFQQRNGASATLEGRTQVSFFYPNYLPGRFGTGDAVWADLEFISSWPKLSITGNREKWMKPRFTESGNYEYSLAGELFLHPELSRDRTLYLDVGFPISLTLGLPAYPKRPEGLIRSGLFVHISGGELFGYLLDDADSFTARSC